MSSNFGNLSDLPAAFTRYTFAPAIPPSIDENCFVCRREFGEIDPNDPDEKPCRALILASCGHHIGSECVLEFINHAATKECPFCRTTIDPSISAIPFWLTWISATSWFYHRDRYTRSFTVAYINLPQLYIDYLNEHLFARDLRFDEAFHLWYCHAMTGLYGHFMNACYTLSAIFVFWLLTLPRGGQYPELGLIAPSFVDT